VEEVGDSVIIRLLEPAPESEWKIVHKAGDILFVLTRQSDGSLITEWKELADDQKPGTYFKKHEGGTDDFTPNVSSIPEIQPADGMLVFKGLFIGMHLMQAAQVLDAALEFTYSVSEQEESMYNPPEKDYAILAMVGERTIEVTEIRHNIKENNIFRALVNSVDPQLDERIEVHFKALGNMQQAVEKVVDELNTGLGKWQLTFKDGSPYVAMRNLFTVTATDNGRVDGILLEPALSNCWFNVPDMSGSDFAQQFVDSYGIPSLQAKIEVVDPADQGLFGIYAKSLGLVESRAVTTWEYTSPAGYKLSLTDTKKITVEAVASAAQRKFD
jgi:hypothetical protein